MVLRRATEEDVPALRALIPASIYGLSVGYSVRQLERALGPVFGIDTALLADGTLFVAEWDGVLAGCGGWSRLRALYGGSDDRERDAEPVSYRDPAVEPALIRAFFVRPELGRRGTARRLIAACEAAAWDAGFRRMELGATHAGEPLYVSAGYAVTARFEIALADGEVLPAARMEKVLVARPVPHHGDGANPHTGPVSERTS